MLQGVYSKSPNSPHIYIYIYTHTHTHTHALMHLEWNSFNAPCGNKVFQHSSDVLLLLSL